MEIKDVYSAKKRLEPILLKTPLVDEDNAILYEINSILYKYLFGQRQIFLLECHLYYSSFVLPPPILILGSRQP